MVKLGVNMIKIVIADDLEKWRTLCERYVSQLESLYGPIGRVFCNSPDSALAALRSFTSTDLSVLVTDIDFTEDEHEKGGLQLMQEVRRDSALCGIPIIGMTSNPAYEPRIGDQSAIYVPKPRFNPVMYDALEHILKNGEREWSDVYKLWGEHKKACGI